MVLIRPGEIIADQFPSVSTSVPSNKEESWRP